MHGNHSLSNSGMPKRLTWLACMQAELTLGKLTPSHFQAQITPNANGNMHERILVTQLNENLPNCNENLGMWLNENLSFIPM